MFCSVALVATVSQSASAAGASSWREASLYDQCGGGSGEDACRDKGNDIKACSPCDMGQDV